MHGSVRWRRRALALAFVAVPALVATSVGVTDAATPDTSGLTPVTGLISQDDSFQVSKAITSRLAETDPALLGRSDATVLDVLVKLDADPLATYAGTVDGLEATSPAVTGTDLTGTSAAEVAYTGYLKRTEQQFKTALASKVPSAKVVGDPLRVVYGGVRVSVPANQISKVLAVPGVIAVQQDALRQPLTDSSTQFIGANSIYPGLGGKPNAGSGVIFGIIDSGVWPEHPSFADNGNLGAPPAKADGTPRTCDFGDNPLTPAADVFQCNNKLIGGEAFLDTYNLVVGNEVYDTARDSNGHGTHTGSTTAGNPVASAPVLGVDRGPINGVAPGAWVSAYKVCGAQGCFSSDSAAAVGQAILDGVDVINFSISGGGNPLTDAVELAFLDAYNAGVFVAASAGNSGPGASTTDHLSPWVTTVAASTQTREFQSTLTVTADNGDSIILTGASITQGIPAGTPVVMASAAPYGHPLCDAAPTAGAFTGVVVACQRGGNARVDKGVQVLAGGAVGMILYNGALADVETDNHWLPTVHLADGTEFVAFMGAHTGVTAGFTAGAKVNGQGDVMAAFSSRGPAGLFIKPDVTAPGVQILAGHTPTPESTTEGPPGNYYQAIAGTSMSSPHVAGAAVLLAAMHPDWSPGQIKSALMTTATTNVVKEDLVTPADPFDMGGGRINLRVAGNPGLTFNATADQMLSAVVDPLNAVHLNIASIDAPIMPGSVRTTRTVTNVSGRTQTYDVRTTAPAGSSIRVSPSSFTIAPGASRALTVTISSSAPTAQYFGQVRLVPRRPGLPTLHIPVAFIPQQGQVTLASECAPTTIRRNQNTTCTVTATNTGAVDATVNLSTTGDSRLRVTGASGATAANGTASLSNIVLAGNKPGVPALGAGAGPGGGYLPLDLFGGTVTVSATDESITNFNVPTFTYGGREYSRIGITSDGYVVVGGGTSADVDFVPHLPDPAAPNNVLAPLWTDLNPAQGGAIRINVLTDGVDSWIVVDFATVYWGTATIPEAEIWIGVNGVEDITFSYGSVPAAPFPGLAVGAENTLGEGASLGDDVLPASNSELAVVSTPPTAGGVATYTVTARGTATGTGQLTTNMTATTVTGVTRVRTAVTIIR